VRINVNRLRRRSPGRRVLVYLDQSALSALARETRMAGVLASLRASVEAGGALCLRSQEHRDETVLAPREMWDAIDSLADELAIGIEFRAREEIQWNEIHAAAGEFFGISAQRNDEIWREAFWEDPQTPRDRLFIDFLGSAVRVRVRSEPADWQIAEVTHEKAKESQALAQAYAQDRTAAGDSFDRLAEAYVRENIRWTIGLLADPHWFAAHYDRLQAELAQGADLINPDISPGSPFTRLQAFISKGSQTKSLIDRFPALRQRSEEFATSDELCHVPSIAYPAILRAGLAAAPRRRVKPGDGYDIAHLTQGLSRCDVVTADSGMAQLCRERKLVPSRCRLLSYRELEQLPAAIEEAADLLS
jgi:hypothetical protein